MGIGHGTLEGLAGVRRQAIFVFGSNGRLGGAFLEAAARRGMLLGSYNSAHDKAAMRTDWVKPLTLLAERFGSVAIVFASGLTDPNASEADLMGANLAFPLRVIEATADDPQFRYLTIGSVLEGFAALAANNRYLASKAALGTRLCRLAGDPSLDGRITHLRLHTLYGAAPALHSFLGQVYESLRMCRPFPMSEGRQLREYAHVADVARSICALLGRERWNAGARDLSTGEPVMLRELALAVFRAFACEELLQLGALPTPSGENMERHFPRAPAWLLGKPRAPIPGIIDWLSLRLGRPVPEGAGTTLSPSRA